MKFSLKKVLKALIKLTQNGFDTDIKIRRNKKVFGVYESLAGRVKAGSFTDL